MEASQVYNQYVCWSVRQSKTALTTSKGFPRSCLKRVKEQNKSKVNREEVQLHQTVSKKKD